MDLVEHRAQSVRVMRISAALAELNREFAVAVEMPRAVSTEWATRAERRALISARRASWWALLGRAAVDAGLDVVFLQAAMVAQCTERDNARFWRQCARDWQAEASGSVGVGSERHELGVA